MPELPQHLMEHIVAEVPLVGIDTSEEGKEMDALRLLPEHLVEHIVARVPFPAILKARMLNKEWRIKFPLVAKQSCLSWPQYFSYWCESEIVGYDAGVASVRRIAVCNTKVKSHLQQVFSRGTLVATAVMRDRSLQVTVINVMTQKRRKITVPMERGSTWYELILVPAGTDHYELVIWYNWFSYENRHGPPEEKMTFTSYNSQSCTWTERLYTKGNAVKNAAYIEGTLCYIEQPQDRKQASFLQGGFSCITGERNKLQFLRLNIQSGQQTETPMVVEGEVTLYFTVRCGSEIMTVITDSGNLIVSRFDRESSALVEVSKTPISEEDSQRFARQEVHRFGASRNCIYITAFTSATLADEETPPLFSYNVGSKTWSRSSVPRELTSNRIATYPHLVLDLGSNSFVEP